MAGIIYDLVDILEQQKECYEGLLTLAVLKENVLIENDLSAINSVAERESQFLGRSNLLDKRRESLMGDICIILSVDKKSTLLDIANSLKNNVDVAEQLKQLRVDILEIIEKINKQNSINKTLIDHSLELTEFTINAIQGAMVGIQDTTYTGVAKKYEQTQRSFFDTIG